MKKVALLILLVFLTSAWAWPKKERFVVEISGIEITSTKFETAFSSSQFAEGGESAKKEFLDTFILRKLILKEAERLGLDKEPEFLKDIQLFWEQSLLKRTLAKKIKELSIQVSVDDKEIQSYYQAQKDKQFSEKDLPEVYGQIKWLLFRNKQDEAIRGWTNSLREKAKIKIDYKALGIRQED